METLSGQIASGRIHARAWAAGTSLPAPYHVNWLHNLGTAIIIVFPVLAFAITSLRIWGRWHMKHLGLDDLFIVLAMAISIAWTGALYMYHKTRYLGIHRWDIPPHDPMPGLVYDWLIQVLYHPVLALVKSSVLFFHLKLGGTKREVRLAAYVLNTINLSAMVAIIFATAFQCVPANSFWDKSIKNPKCIDNMAFNFFYNALVIVTDVAVLAIPFWVVMGLNMPTRMRIALLGVFFLGFIVTIVSCIRLFFLIRFFNTRYMGKENPDPTYTLGWTTSTIECNLAIMVASIPPLWPLMRRTFPTIFSKLDGGSRHMGVGVHQRPPGHGSRTRSSRGKGKSGHFGISTSSRRVYASDDSSFAMQSMRGYGTTEIRSQTPEDTEEYDGIMRTTKVDVAYEQGSMLPEEGFEASVQAWSHGGPMVIDEKEFVSLSSRAR